jgi:aminomethyltransferase
LQNNLGATVSLKRTAFYDKHVSLGAKIVPFAGYEMPIQYPNGIIHEHKKVRNTVGVFDVSHMGEFIVKGPDALAFLNKTTTNDVSKLVNGQAHYSAMCYEHGGIVDDLLVYKFPDYYFLVVNASNIDKDFAHLDSYKMANMSLENVSDSYSQLAVQGKDAEKTLQKLTQVNLAEIKYYHYVEAELAGLKMIISRTGYTGEPGFEIYFNASKSNEIWDAVFSAGADFGIEAIGLGARDSLRLEKKMALYGNDIDQTTDPLSAGLAFVTKFDKGDFVGKAAIEKIKAEGCKRRLVGLLFDDKKAFPRSHYKIVDDANIEIGEITSGTISPMLQQGVAMAYVPDSLSKVGTVHKINIRNTIYTAKIVKGAFL